MPSRSQALRWAFETIQREGSFIQHQRYDATVDFADSQTAMCEVPVTDSAQHKGKTATRLDCRGLQEALAINSVVRTVLQLLRQVQ